MNASIVVTPFIVNAVLLMYAYIDWSPAHVIMTFYDHIIDFLGGPGLCYSERFHYNK